MEEQFDAIVIGSGISGGWAAKELCEKGMKTLVLDRSRNLFGWMYQGLRNHLFFIRGNESPG